MSINYREIDPRRFGLSPNLWKCLCDNVYSMGDESTYDDMVSFCVQTYFLRSKTTCYENKPDKYFFVMFKNACLSFLRTKKLIKKTEKSLCVWETETYEEESFKSVEVRMLTDKVYEIIGKEDAETLKVLLSGRSYKDAEESLGLKPNSLKIKVFRLRQKWSQDPRILCLLDKPLNLNENSYHN
jgi:DNA-directed RNA polymerase specialized sigma24 family protein